LATATALTIIFLAAIVRGYSGFGFSLIAITGLALIYPVASIVPAIFLMEIAATIHMLPSIWKDIHWRSLLPLIVGCLIATPLGLMALSYVSPENMQIALSIFVLAAVALMFKGFALNAVPGTTAAIAAGGSAGFCNGAFGIAGPPVILFYFSSPAGNVVGRASIAAFFFFTDVIGLSYATPMGLLSMDTLWRAALFLPALLAGVWVGSRSFKSADQEQFRRWMLLLLAFMALLLLGKALWPAG